MNLRSEIHAAIDEVGPPAPGLPREVLEFVFSEGKRPPGRSVGRHPRWALGMRHAGSFVAAVLVVVLLVTVVVGGRILRDRSLSPRPQTIDQAELAELRARPLSFPVVQRGAECPSGPQTALPQSTGVVPLAYGTGPVYAEGSGSRVVTNWGTYFVTAYWFDPKFKDLALIRASDLDTQQPVVFAKTAYSKPSGASLLTGPLVGEDVIFDQRVQRYSELVLDGAHPGPKSWPGEWPVWGMTHGFAKGASGCIGFQADGPGFTEHWVVSYSIP